MDIKKIIEELIAKIKDDKDFGSKFKSDPVKAVEKATGVDLPDEKIEKVVKEVASKVSVDDVKDKVGDVVSKFKK